MHDLIKQLLELTRQHDGNFDEMSYKEIQHFLKERDRLINVIQQTSFTEDEIAENRDTVMEILSYDKVIIDKLQQLKDAAGNEITKFSAAKHRKQAYDGYAAYSGAYYDKRK